MVKKLPSEGLGRVEISKQLSLPAGAADSMLKKLRRDRGECSRKKGPGRPRSVSTQIVEAEARRGQKISITELAS